MNPCPDHCGRRWQDDPDLREHIEHLLVELSQEFHQQRGSHGWSQDALARVAGVSDNTIKALEQARTDPHISTLVRLAFCFGYEVDVRLRRQSGPRRHEQPDIRPESGTGVVVDP